MVVPLKTEKGNTYMSEGKKLKYHQNVGFSDVLIYTSIAKVSWETFFSASSIQFTQM